MPLIHSKTQGVQRIPVGESDAPYKSRSRSFSLCKQGFGKILTSCLRALMRLPIKMNECCRIFILIDYVFSEEYDTRNSITQTGLQTQYPRKGGKTFTITWKIRITISLVIISEIRLTGNKILKLINA